MRYSCSRSPGSCFITSKTPLGTNRVASLKATISPILNLWGAIGSMPFRADNRQVVILTQLTRGPIEAHAAKRPDPPIAGGGPGLATSTTALSGADDRFPHTTKSCGSRFAKVRARCSQKRDPLSKRSRCCPKYKHSRLLDTASGWVLAAGTQGANTQSLKAAFSVASGTQ